MGRMGDETTGRKIRELENKWTIEKNESRKKKIPKDSGIGSIRYLWKLR